MTSNRHIVDQLADVRAEIKALQEREKDLKKAVSEAMGNADSLGGDEFIAMQKVSERKGALDEKAMRAYDINPDDWRKPSITVYQITTESRVSEEA